MGKLTSIIFYNRGIFMFLFLTTASYKNVIFNRYIQLESAKNIHSFKRENV